MAEIDTAAVRSQTFSVVRKGYDRGEVDAYLATLAGHVEALDDRIAVLEAQFEQLGIAEPRDLAAELEAVGDEVAAVLTEAQAAAEAMRRRASEDAARWRSEADVEVRRWRAEAEEQVQALRRSAWEESTEAVEQAVDTRDEMIASAEQDVLLLRAEAEQEASRLTHDARRIREEATRDAREEAERIVADARSEAESIMAMATREAEVAQRRAQALEARRVELLNELESTQASIGGEALPPVPPAGGPDEAGLETVADPAPELRPFDEEAHRTHWGPDEVGSVKIVSGDHVIRRGPVDADALAAEVQALRERDSGEIPVVAPDAAGPTVDVAVPPAYEPTPPVPPAPAVAPEVQAEPIREAESAPEAKSDVAPEAETVDEAMSGAEPDLETGDAPESERAVEPADAPKPEVAPEPESGAGADAVEGTSEAKKAPEPQPEEMAGTGRDGDLRDMAEDEPAIDGDSLAGLFERLRHPTPDVQDEGEDETRDGGGPAAPETGVLPTLGEPATVVAKPDIDPFSLRDRALLPIQNRALRNIKRALVDLQNQALGGLRADGDWSVGPGFFSQAVRGDLAVMARESTIAGMAAASELTNAESTPSAGGVPSPDPTDEFAAALADATGAALRRSREAGAGARETAATVSRVFRAWRTDEAERRVRAASFAAYHTGLIAAAQSIGVSRVSVESSGHACPECPAGRGSWAIDDGPPPGTSLPPARVDCGCVVIPSN